MTQTELQAFIDSIGEKEIASKAREIAATYKGALNEIRAEMADVYARLLSKTPAADIYAEMVKYDRLGRLEAAIIKKYNSYHKQIGVTIEQSSRQALSNEYYRSQYSTNWLDPYGFTVLNDNALDFAVTGQPELLKKIMADDRVPISPRAGKTLKKIMADNRAVELARVLETVNNGLLRGLGYRGMSRELKDTFDKNLNNALRVVRTESHRAMETGKYLQYKDAQRQGVNLVRRISSVLDNRTRAQSAQVDGRIDKGKGFLYPDGNYYFIPGNTGRAAWDINDREAVTQVSERFPVQVRRGRNPVTGKNEVIDFKSFKAWAEEKGLKKNKYGEILFPGEVRAKPRAGVMVPKKS